MTAASPTSSERMIEPELLITGEAVALEITPATVANRITSGLIDYAVYALGAGLSVVVVLVLAISTGSEFQENLALTRAMLSLALLAWVVVIPLLVELLSGGRSLGRMVTGARVVRDDGGTVRLRHCLVRTLLDAGAIVVCSGGGGVPVVRSEEGKLKGIEAVIDKDLTASVMAEALEADALLILTDVDGVFRDFGTENQKQVPRATPAELRSMGLPSGSMGPKVEAVCRFVELTGDMAAIGRLEDAVSIIEGHAGTIVTPGGNYGGPDDIHPPIPEQLDTRIRRA